MLSRPTHYEILGLLPDAEKSAIVKAYRRFSIILHPDKGLTNRFVQTLEAELKAIFPEAWRRISDAYETLTDDAKRKHYDVTLPQYSNKEEDETAFFKSWKKLLALYEVHFEYAELEKDPTEYVEKTLREKKEAKAEIKTLTTANQELEKETKQLKGHLQESTSEIQLLHKTIHDLMTRLTDAAQKAEKELKQKLEEQKQSYERQLQTAREEAHRALRSSPSMFSASVSKLKNPIQLRREFTEMDKKFTFMGVNVGFDTFEAASHFYQELVKSPDAKFEIDIPEKDRSSSYLHHEKPKLYFVKIKMQFSATFSHIRTLSDAEQTTAILEKVKKHCDISLLSPIDWDTWKFKPLQKSTPQHSKFKY